MRLTNISKIGKYEYRVVLDSKKESVNYIERTTGVYFDREDHRCLKCTQKVM